MTIRRIRLGVAAAVLLVLVLGIGLQVVAPPSNANVAGMLAMWVHGTAVQVEYPDRLDQVLRRGFHTRIEGKAGTGNWLHFPISTPVVGTYRRLDVISGWETNYRRYRLDKVFISFRSGSTDARVTSVHVYDGPTRIAAFDNLNLFGEQSMREFVIPGSPAVSQGICVSLGVQFGSTLRWMELQSVGADFYFEG
jgi:hypothetical protein